ncbi:plexin-B2-like isoform X2 [Mizuhopecten yessoensis]|uniref:plexin-B2-like isoform X2 n=1 Tax=Mizuhopecten yessoensis TaxID=6573 RepID=UPI000B45C9CF|nr:plexin-B2-like isoform X2 [Mizuhopecten yessoensis]
MNVLSLSVILFGLAIKHHNGFASDAKEFRPLTERLPEFRKIAVDSSGRNIYIGGKNFIYHLDEDLTQVGVVETGPRRDSKECTKVDVDSERSGCNIQLYDDFTQLLQVYEPGGILVTCGTLYLGRCVGRNLRDISIVNITSISYLAVSADETGSTESVIAKVGTESLLFVGKSYVKTTEKLENIYTQVRDIIYGGQLQENNLLEPYETSTGVQTTFSIKTVNNHAEQKYGFVIKDMFYMSDSIYSLLRIMDRTTRRTVSKVAKMCAMAFGTSGANSYEDMPIECSGFPYVQDGFVIQHGSSEVLVALFSSTADVTKNTPSAVCVFTEDELLEGFKKSRMNPTSCANPRSYPVDYLQIQGNRGCVNYCSTTDPLCQIFNTTTYCNGLPSLSSLVGVIPLTMSPVFNGTGLTSLGGSFRNNLTTIVVGTQIGTIFKLFLKSTVDARLLGMVQEDRTWNKPILDILTSPLHRTYLLTEFNVVELRSPDHCDTSSCSDCMDLADSKCGWCVLDGGACMEKTSCSVGSFWLPSVEGECLRLYTFPPGIRHQFTSTTTNVSVILSPPVPISGDDWQCQYGTNECKPDGIPCKSDLIISGSMMFCSIEARTAFRQHVKYADFKVIRKRAPTYVLVEGWHILFYDCTGFQTCYECLTNPKAIFCFWDPVAASCTNTYNVRSYYKYSSSRCPSITESKFVVIPNNETADVVISGHNLPSNVSDQYRCYINGQTFNVSTVNSTSITCLEVKISYSRQTRKEDIPVHIHYRGVLIDSHGNVTATVYKCEFLADSCYLCYYLRTMGYLCSWSQVRQLCEYMSTINIQQCPPPIVSSVFPSSGPVSGGTILTIEGTDFGGTPGDIDSIFISNIPCLIVNSTFHPTSVKCRTVGTSKEQLGARIVIKVKGKDSTNVITFNYVEPVLYNFYPTYGIRAGGRLLTLKGSNLLSGDQNRMKVELYHTKQTSVPVLCALTAVQPNVNNVVCRVDPYRGVQLPFSFDGVNVTYDGGALTTSMGNINFTFVDNPSITIYSQDISAEGVEMTVTGTQLSAISDIKIGQSVCQVLNDTMLTCPVILSVASVEGSGSCEQDQTLSLDNYNYQFQVITTQNTARNNTGTKRLTTIKTSCFTRAAVSAEGLQVFTGCAKYVTCIGKYKISNTEFCYGSTHQYPLCCIASYCNEDQLLRLSLQQVNEGNADEVTSQLIDISTTSETYLPTDVNLTIYILEELVNLPNTQNSNKRVIDIIQIMSNLLDSPEAVLSQAQTEFMAPTRYLQTVEKLINDATLANLDLRAVKPNLAVFTHKIQQANFSGYTLHVEHIQRKQFDLDSVLLFDQEQPFSGTSSLIIPDTLLHGLTTNELEKVSGISFAVFVNAKLFTAISNTKPLTNGDSSFLRTPNSLIIAASVPNVEITNLSNPIMFRFDHISKNARNASCVFWNQSVSGKSAWSNQGCRVQESDDNSRTICLCNHFTNFALLMDIYGTGDSLNDIHRQIMSLISYVGCGLSVLGLVMTIVTFCVIRKLRGTNPSKILMNLCVALISTNSIFLVGQQQYVLDHSTGCQIVACLQHFFLLSAMAWMVVEAFYMYLALVKIIPMHISKFLLKCCVLGWGVPLIIVALTMGINNQHYGLQPGEICWLDRTPLYVAFVAPVMLMVVINGVVFVLVARQLLGVHSGNLSITHKASTLTRLRRAVAVLILLGLTWVFAVFAFEGAGGLVFQYLFIILNSLQGLLIFIFYCVLNKDTRDNWMKKFPCRTKKTDTGSTQTSRDDRGKRYIVANAAYSSQDNLGEANSG